MSDTLRRIAKISWLAEFLTIVGAAWYTWQLWIFAHFQESVLDEGAYVYKGWLFASGQYTPYQPYGPWTNHMPLAFLIPGYLQIWFGTGIRTARVAAIGWALLLLLGMVILSRRFGNRWWVAAVVWALALNPALMKTYSTAITQGLVACMLVWTLALTLGKDRPLWQLLLGSALAGLILMTRFNMIAVLPLLALYIAWEYGLRTGLAVALTGAVPIMFLHALYWPDVLQAWTRIPRSLSPFLDAYRLPSVYDEIWEPDVSQAGRFASLFHGIRYNFTELIGPLALVFLWPKKDRWSSRSQFRAVIFLLALFFSLMALHLWASLGKDYCVYCFAGYTAFYSEIGLLLVVLTASMWRQKLSVWTQALIVAAILIISAGIGYGAFEQIGDQLRNFQIPRWLMADFRGGTVSLEAILTNKFGLEGQLLRRALPLVFGLASGAALLLAAAGAVWWTRRRKTGSNLATSEKPLASPASGKPVVSFGYLALVGFLIAGSLLSPTPALGGGYGTYDCSSDVFASYEAAGKRLASQIPPGSLAYWKGTLSVIPMLYAPQVSIYPAQINDGYSMLTVGDDLDLITRLGFWNETLSEQWAEQADYVLIEQRSYKGSLREQVLKLQMEELEPTPLTVGCRPDSYIRIFKQNH